MNLSSGSGKSTLLATIFQYIYIYTYIYVCVCIYIYICIYNSNLIFEVSSRMTILSNSNFCILSYNKSKGNKHL